MVRCSLVRWFIAIWCGFWCVLVLSGVVRYGLVWSGVVRCEVWFSVDVWSGPVLVWSGLVRLGSVWSGVIRRGSVRSGEPALRRRQKHVLREGAREASNVGKVR